MSLAIRPAVAGDRIRIIRMLRDAHRAAGFDDGTNPLQYAFAPAYADRAFQSHSAGDDAICLVLDVEGSAQGVLMARVFDYELGDIRIAKETVWWIDPERRGLAADDMLTAYERWAFSRGASVSGMAALSKAMRVAHIYQRRGYEPVETHFLKALPQAA